MLITQSHIFFFSALPFLPASSPFIFSLSCVDSSGSLNQLSLRCYVDYLQSVLATYISQTLRRDVLAPHPDGHVGVFASPTEKVSHGMLHCNAS